MPAFLYMAIAYLAYAWLAPGADAALEKGPEPLGLGLAIPDRARVDAAPRRRARGVRRPHRARLVSAAVAIAAAWLSLAVLAVAAYLQLGIRAAVDEAWVLSLELTPLQFLILAQIVIFLLGWPLEWTEIIVIFMPIFIPLLAHFEIDPLFFGLLVALNLQIAFLSPPVAMAALYLKGVAPPHVTLGQIFAGVLPFMAIQLAAIVLLYLFPQIGLWLPAVLYG